MDDNLPVPVGLDQLSEHQLGLVDAWLVRCEEHFAAGYRAALARGEVPVRLRDVNQALYYRHARGAVRYLRAHLHAGLKSE